MSQPYHETITTTAFSKRVGYYYDEAIRRAVGLERHGEVRVVMVPADEYASLRKLFARAMKSEQFKDVIHELISAPSSFHSDAPDSYEDDSAGEPAGGVQAKSASRRAKQKRQAETA
jgi:hypothetical protein